MMYVVNYFVTNIKTGEKDEIIVNDFLGGIGDIIFEEWLITDYAEEYLDFDGSKY